MSSLCVQFDDSKTDSLVAIFDESQDSELFWRISKAIRDFTVRVPVSNGHDEIVLRWTPEHLLESVDEHEGILFTPAEGAGFKLRFRYYVGSKKKNIKYVVDAIKELIIQICTSCGCYSEVLVQG